MFVCVVLALLSVVCAQDYVISDETTTTEKVIVDTGNANSQANGDFEQKMKRWRSEEKELQLRTEIIGKNYCWNKNLSEEQLGAYHDCQIRKYIAEYVRLCNDFVYGKGWNNTVIRDQRCENTKAVSEGVSFSSYCRLIAYLSLVSNLLPPESQRDSQENLRAHTK